MDRDTYSPPANKSPQLRASLSKLAVEWAAGGHRIRSAELIASLTANLILATMLFRVARRSGGDIPVSSPGLFLMGIMAMGYPASLYLLSHRKLLRIWSFFGMVSLGYLSIGLLLREFPGYSVEATLKALDGMLKFDVYQLAGAGLPGWLSEIFGMAYLFYFPYCIGRAYSIIRNLDEKSERFFLAMVLIYGAGFFGYMLAPALGPRYAVPGTFPPTGPLFSSWAVTLVNKLGSPWAVMPSMHVAATALVFFYDIRYHRHWALICAVPVVTLWAATLGLGFHYLVDVATGLSIAAGSLALSHKIPIWFPAPSISLPKATPGSVQN